MRSSERAMTPAEREELQGHLTAYHGTWSDLLANAGCGFLCGTILLSPLVGLVLLTADATRGWALRHQLLFATLLALGPAMFASWFTMARRGRRARRDALVRDLAHAVVREEEWDLVECRTFIDPDGGLLTYLCRDVDGSVICIQDPDAEALHRPSIAEQQSRFMPRRRLSLVRARWSGVVLDAMRWGADPFPPQPPRPLLGSAPDHGQTLVMDWERPPPPFS